MSSEAAPNFFTGDEPINIGSDNLQLLHELGWSPIIRNPAKTSLKNISQQHIDELHNPRKSFAERGVAAAFMAFEASDPRIRSLDEIAREIEELEPGSSSARQTMDDLLISTAVEDLLWEARDRLAEEESLYRYEQFVTDATSKHQFTNTAALYVINRLRFARQFQINTSLAREAETLVRMVIHRVEHNDWPAWHAADETAGDM